MYGRILVPTDGSACSEVAVQHALQLAKAIGAEVTFLCVFQPMAAQVVAQTRSYVLYVQELDEERKRSKQEMLDKCVAAGKQAGARVRSRLVSRPRPAEGILNAANKHDLIVMASHGRTGVSRLLLGSVTEAVTRHSTIPVLVVRGVPKHEDDHVQRKASELELAERSV